jgi:flagella basal body P-ring formation protein FlgA
MAALLVPAAAFAATAERSVLTESMVRKAVTDFLLRRTAGLGVEVRLKSMSYRGEAPLPSGTVTYEILSPQDWEGWGHGALALLVRVNGRVEKNIPVNVDVEGLSDMVVTTHPLEYGALVEKGDVALQKRDLATAPGRVCRSLDEVLGKRVRVGMRGNTPVRNDYLERMPIIKSGQIVTIVAENDAFRVTATGRARGNGAEGDTVMVQNLEAQKTMPATVVDATTVRVEF